MIISLLRTWRGVSVVKLMHQIRRLFNLVLLVHVQLVNRAIVLVQVV